MTNFKRIPTHIGIIPDGNRRWALENDLEKNQGYPHGVDPGVALTNLLIQHGVKEATFYGFTKDNNKRPVAQREAFTKACVDSVQAVAGKDANILVVGNADSPLFPEELRPYAGERVHYGKGLINLNFLINYDWKADLEAGVKSGDLKHIMSRDISRIDLIIRWGGRTRLSGFLPVQSVYADFFVLDNYWPSFQPVDLTKALTWYQTCDPTLGG